MKKVFLSLIVAMVSTISMSAQQIAVVKGDVTKVYTTLKDAIEGADDGSVVYLPGGGFPIADDIKITKKLTIIGISHTASSDNVDGRTAISGNLFFDEGSSGSAFMGCYVSGNVNIGSETSPVNDILLRYNNLNSIQVSNTACRGIEVNQNYIRNTSDFGKSNAMITNNIIHSIINLDGGQISNNVITSLTSLKKGNSTYHYFITAVNSVIIYNVMLANKIGQGWDYVDYYGTADVTNCEIRGNMLGYQNWGEECVILKTAWNDVFKSHKGVSPESDYHFKDNYKDYESKYLYGGTGFKEEALPPVPYIQSYEIDEQTDAEGKLNIRINVKAVTE